MAGSASDGEWAVLVFDDSPASVSFAFESGGTVENQTWVYPVHAYNHSQSVTPYGHALRTHRPVPAGAVYKVNAPETGRSSLYVQAASIRLETGTTAGRLAEKPDSHGVSDFMRTQDESDRIHRHVRPSGSHAVVQFQPEPSTTFRLRAEGVRHVEWHSAQVECQGADWCPDGGTTSITRVAPLPGTDFNVTSEQFSYDIATGGLGEVRGEGAFAYAILGGSQLTFAVDDGRIRLPLASLQGACSGCSMPDNQTLMAGGDLVLGTLVRTAESRLEATLGGSVSEARLDERAVDPSALLGVEVAVGTIAVAALGVAMLKLLGALFTKWKDRDVLDSPRRRLIHEAICAHPGVGFRELTRRTGLAIGTVRHNLDVLLRHGKIVERRHGAALRFFENHGKYDRTWSRVAVLRDDATRQVYDWLVANPDRAQGDVVGAMVERGLSRSGAQRRLVRLLTAGLVSVQQRGRHKVYRAI